MVVVVGGGVLYRSRYTAYQSTPHTVAVDVWCVRRAPVRLLVVPKSLLQQLVVEQDSILLLARAATWSTEVTSTTLPCV